MTTCCKCKKLSIVVHRTNPLGSENAGWMCEPCIEKHHDKSLINEEVKEITDILSNKKPL